MRAGLRPLARLGCSQRAITEQAVRLSLKRDQAEVLAAAVAEEYQMLEAPRLTETFRVEQGAAVADPPLGQDIRGTPDPRVSPSSDPPRSPACHGSAGPVYAWQDRRRATELESAP